jgi:hypothetical protein
VPAESDAAAVEVVSTGTETSLPESVNEPASDVTNRSVEIEPADVAPSTPADGEAAVSEAPQISTQDVRDQEHAQQGEASTEADRVGGADGEIAPAAAEETEEAAAARQNTPSALVNVSSDASVSPTVVTGRGEVNPGDAGQVWSQVVDQINDMLKSHVKQVSKAAIAAPNKLELTFPRKYHFSKRYCEKPEVISRLEQLAAQVTGQNLRVSLVMSEDDGPSDAQPQQETSVKKPARKQRVYKPEDDDFVTTVMETFDAECVRVDSRAGASTSEE